jgi:solute carrier family 25 (mitochondrial carnitine/acylcarnitine transporter), member 20/29
MASKIEQVPVAAPTPLPTEEKKFAQLRSFIAGGVGGVAAVITGHPFDLVKVRLQTAEKGLYTGAIDVVKKSIARDGLTRGLYAGVTAPLLGVTPMCKSSPQSSSSRPHTRKSQS